MSIAFDATYSIGPELSGVGVYCRELLNGLAASHPEEDFLWCYRPHRFLRGRQQSFPPNCRPYLLHDRWRVPQARIFHGLNQRMPQRPVARGVCTIHDLFVMTGEYSTPEFRTRFTQMAREAAGRSDLIVTVSQFTAEQVHELLGVERSRLRVVHHGVRTCQGVKVEREPMVLHVGAVQDRKNITRLIEAFEAHVPAPWRLILAGGFGYGSEKILSRIAASPARERIEHSGFVTSAKLEELYARASIFAFPSLDEGFGMPVLEAMSRGVPVIASRRSALPEVCGDAALLVDPLQVDEIGEALKRLAGSEAERRECVQRGLAHAAQFTWERAAAETWSVYEELR